VPGFTVSSPAPNVLRITHGGNADDFTLDSTTGLPIKSSGVSLANPDRPVHREMHYEAWTTVSGIRFPTRRVNYLEGLKLGEITGSAIRINVGLSPEQLGRQPSDFMPDVLRP
jgi:hypothetical protein